MLVRSGKSIEIQKNLILISTHQPTASSGHSERSDIEMDLNAVMMRRVGIVCFFANLRCATPLIAVESKLVSISERIKIQLELYVFVLILHHINLSNASISPAGSCSPLAFQ